VRGVIVGSFICVLLYLVALFLWDGEWLALTTLVVGATLGAGIESAWHSGYKGSDE
jgi:hypothetical protein